MWRDFSSTATRKGSTNALFCLQSDSSSCLEVKCAFGKMSLVCDANAEAGSKQSRLQREHKCRLFAWIEDEHELLG